MIIIGEDLRVTATREAFEETGININPNEIKLIDTLSGESRKNSYPNGDIVYNNTSLYLADV
ncbi:MAG: NUDIX domain-containing protein [Bacilli bacterium]|nr:NUDIX domain-containing protein [Bacilli bacterium]